MFIDNNINNINNINNAVIINDGDIINYNTNFSLLINKYNSELLREANLDIKKLEIIDLPCDDVEFNLFPYVTNIYFYGNYNFNRLVIYQHNLKHLHLDYFNPTNSLEDPSISHILKNENKNINIFYFIYNMPNLETLIFENYYIESTYIVKKNNKIQVVTRNKPINVYKINDLISLGKNLKKLKTLKCNILLSDNDSKYDNDKDKIYYNFWSNSLVISTNNNDNNYVINANDRLNQHNNYLTSVIFNDLMPNLQNINNLKRIDYIKI